mgnify:CR=1 FL=1
MNKFHYIIAKHDDDVYDKYIKKSMRGKRPIVVNDSPELNSMTKKYNEGIKRIKNLKANDYVIFVHEDVYISDDLFEGKIQMIFGMHQDVGVLGIYGTTQYIGGGWWSHERPTYAVGNIMQMTKDGKIHNMRENLPPGMLRKDMVVVDGCMMIVRGSVINKHKIKFDESITGFHQYDNSFCLEVLLKTPYKVAVSDFDILHVSEGAVTDEWMTQSLSLINRYKELGLTIPLTSEKIKEVNYGKVQ